MMPNHRGLTWQGVEDLIHSQDICVKQLNEDEYQIIITGKSEVIFQALQMLRVCMTLGQRMYQLIGREESMMKGASYEVGHRTERLHSGSSHGD